MFHYYLAVLKKYAVFSGRARRAEYWYFYLVNFIIHTVYNVAYVVVIMQGLRSLAGSLEIGNGDVLIPGWFYPLSIIYLIYELAVFIPSIAVGVRRMHDVNKSGWFLLIPVYNIVLAATDGTKGDNEYGPDPKVKIS